MKNNKLIIVFLLILSLIMTSCSIGTSSLPVNENHEYNSELLVYFIDVGQADCTLIQLPNGEDILIDTGNYADADLVLDILDTLNVDDIEYLILTHPHEDHMGSASEILKEVKVDKIYMPDISHDTKFYSEAMEVIKKQNIPLINVTSGLTIIDTPDIKFKTLAPNSMYYSEMNEYSIVTRLDYKNNSFLFTGDAESVSELEMIDKGYYLKSDVLQIGHHGGRTSSSKEFLDVVRPKYSIISCGKDNSYSHPHKETLKRLEAINTEIYRTDELGTIIVSSDGKNIKLINDNISNNSNKNKEIKYVGNKNTRKFHLPDCSSVKTIKKENTVFFKNKQSAQNQGYEPCGSCKP